MGFLRGLAIFLFTILLVISVLAMAFTWTVSWSLQYENVQPALKEAAKDFIKTSFLGEDFGIREDQLQYSCLVQENYELSYDMINISVPCEVMGQGADSIIEYAAEPAVQQIYYAEYDCEMWDCLKESSIPFFLFSEKSMDYWKDKFIIFVGLSLIIFVLIFLISKKRPANFIITGLILILCALPFDSLRWALFIIPSDFASLFSVFFTKSHSVFIIMLILGIAFAVAGILCLIFGWKMKFNPDEEEVESKKEKESSKDKKK